MLFYKVILYNILFHLKSYCLISLEFNSSFNRLNNRKHNWINVYSRIEYMKNDKVESFLLLLLSFLFLLFLCMEAF